MTLLKDRLHEAGFDRLRFDALAFARNFFNSGGTLDLWNEIGATVANEMAGKGHMRIDLQKGDVDPRQPNPEPGGQVRVDAQSNIAPSAREPIAGSGGQLKPALQVATAPAVQQLNPGETSQTVSDAHVQVARPVREPIASGEAKGPAPVKATEMLPPAREPDEAFRAALARDRAQTNVIWLATHKTSDGRFWSHICPYEFDGMERDGRVAAVIKQIYGPFSAKQMKTPLGELITPAIEKKIVRALEKRDAA